jgi:HPt (histidine-containing phosphotransfer) domain-containing protein
MTEELVNWEEALNQVGGERDFLREVLGDLETECDSAIEEIKNGIKGKNFEDIRKAAHRIKGSASYLCCNRLREIALKLQEAGHTGELGAPNPAKLLTFIEEMFGDFQTIFEDTKTEIRQFFGE